MSGERVNMLRVRTPEGVVFAFPLAGPVTRCLACLVDFFLIVAVARLLQFVLLWLAWVSIDFAVGLMLISMFAVQTAFGIVFEWWWRGQTPGKKLFRLRVVDEGGLPLGFGQVVVRNLVRTVDSLPALYVLGGVVMMLSRRAQRLGDIAAGTVVVRHRRTREPDFAQLFAGKYNSLREHAHLAARLRQQVPPDLAAAAMDALLRRDALEAAARITLFGELAAVFRRLAAYPAEVTAGMPDEVYVRNVVEIVYAAGAGPSNAAASAIASASRSGQTSTASASQ